MAGSDVSDWLYGGTPRGDRPADLGYFVGFRIAQAYYERALALDSDFVLALHRMRRVTSQLGEFDDRSLDYALRAGRLNHGSESSRRKPCGSRSRCDQESQTAPKPVTSDPASAAARRVIAPK